MKLVSRLSPCRLAESEFGRFEEVGTYLTEVRGQKLADVRIHKKAQFQPNYTKSGKSLLQKGGHIEIAVSILAVVCVQEFAHIRDFVYTGALEGNVIRKNPALVLFLDEFGVSFAVNTVEKTSKGAGCLQGYRRAVVDESRFNCQFLFGNRLENCIFDGVQVANEEFLMYDGVLRVSVVVYFDAESA